MIRVRPAAFAALAIAWAGVSTRAAPSGAGRAVVPGVDDRWVVRLERADAEFAAGRFRAGIEILQEAVERGEDRLLPVDDGTRLLPVAEVARDRLARLPAPALASYRNLYGRAAADLLRRAEDTLDERGLERAVELYFPTESAARALRILGDIAFERGAFGRAAAHWGRLLRGHPEGAKWAEALRGPLSACDGARAGRPVRATRRPWLWDLRRPEDGVAVLPFSVGRVAWKSDLWSEGGINPLLQLYTGPGRIGGGSYPVHFEFFPEPDDGRVLMWGLWEVHGLDLRTGKDRYGWPKPARPDLERYGYREASASFTGQAWIARGILLASYVDAVVRAEQYMGYAITRPIPRRGLAGVDAARGEILWETSRTGGLADLSFAGPVIVRGDRVYAGAWGKSGYVDAYVVCLELETGRPRWRSLVCSNQLELTIFGELAVEPFGACLAERDGVVYAVPHLGAVAALEARDGRILWVTRYETVPIHSARGRMPIPRRLDWAHNPIILDGDRIYVTPRDSRLLLALDDARGRVLRSWRNTQGLRHVLGLWKGRLYATGRDRIVSLDPRREGSTWVAIGTTGRRGATPIYGRSQLCDRGILFSSSRGLMLLAFGGRAPRFFAPYRWSGGAVAGATPSGPGNARGGASGTRSAGVEKPVDAGNVRVWEDRVFVASRSILGCYVDAGRPGGSP